VEQEADDWINGEQLGLGLEVVEEESNFAQSRFEGKK